MTEVEKKYPLASSSWDNREIEAIQRVVQSGFYSMGTEVNAFEKEFAEYAGTRFCVMCSSGSMANLLMTAALFYRKKNPLKRGDEIIVPAVSWSTTYYPLSQYGLKLKFVDVDLETLNYDLAALEKAIGPQTKAIMIVNLLGNPNDFRVIKKIVATRPDIALIEDNCESLGATFEGKQCGTFGEMGTYSFFFSHHISTMEGGAIVTNDEELYHILLCLRAHGWTRNLPQNNHVSGTKSDIAFEESFKFYLPGYNARPLEMSGAIGREQLKKLPTFIRERRENAKYFEELFRHSENFIIQKETGESSWFGFSFILRPTSAFKRSEIANQLAEAQIDCRPIVTGNFAKNKVVHYFDYKIHAELKNADIVETHGFFVGNHHFPIREKIDYLYEVLVKSLR